jgi:DNA-binding beta-propeller fold protein YncE
MPSAALPIAGLPALAGAVGSQYQLSLNRLVFVEFGGQVSAIDMATASYAVLGTGYNQPEDIVLSDDGTHAFVSERTGDFLEIDLNSAARASARVVAAGMTAPHQIALDEPHGQAYLVEFASPGRLIRVDLASGAQTVLVPDLDSAIGLLMSRDGQFAYVTEQVPTGRLSRIQLSSGAREVLFTSATAPLFFMKWADPGQGAILVTERDPANEVWLVDLTSSPAAVRSLATGVPARPSSVSPMSADRLLVCSDSTVSEVDILGGIYSAGGPMFLGIGHVPVDRIFGGYADTTGDPGYFFQVKDSPFGGSLPILFNHERAQALGGTHYAVLVDAAAQTDPWSDYLWDPIGGRFGLQTIAPVNGSFFPIHQYPGELWFNHWLGYFLDTSGLPDGLHTIEVRLYSAPDPSAAIDISAPAFHASVDVLIDNRWPVASINRILHDGGDVGTCAIVDSGSYEFAFDITAAHAGGHLRSWALSAMWGDNKSAAIASDGYPSSTAAEAPPMWHGLPGGPGLSTLPVPAWDCGVSGPVPPRDPTSWHCAHTFFLSAWDRVINGWGYIHYSDYHKSITIWLPDPPFMRLPLGELERLRRPKMPIPPGEPPRPG